MQGRLERPPVVEPGLAVPQVGHKGHARAYEAERPVSRQKRRRVHGHGTAVGGDETAEQWGQALLPKRQCAASANGNMTSEGHGFKGLKQIHERVVSVY